MNNFIREFFESNNFLTNIIIAIKSDFELLIANYDGTVSDGSFQIAQGTIHEAHAALSDLLGAAKNAASTISFAGFEK